MESKRPEPSPHPTPRAAFARPCTHLHSSFLHSPGQEPRSPPDLGSDLSHLNGLLYLHRFILGGQRDQVSIPEAAFPIAVAPASQPGEGLEGAREGAGRACARIGETGAADLERGQPLVGRNPLPPTQTSQA